MSVRTITENGYQLTVESLEKVNHLGMAYWQGRAMFRVADGHARADVVTSAQLRIATARRKLSSPWLARMAGALASHPESLAASVTTSARAMLFARPGAMIAEQRTGDDAAAQSHS